MKVKVNNETHEVAEGTSLAALVTQLGLNTQGIAVAIQYEVIPKENWEKILLSEGQELMLIQAVSGG